MYLTQGLHRALQQGPECWRQNGFCAWLAWASMAVEASHIGGDRALPVESWPGASA